VETGSDVNIDRQGQHDRSCPRRVGVIWALLFVNVLDPAGGAVVPIPHKVARLIAQGALFTALVLVLTINPRMRIRPNWFLGLSPCSQLPRS